MLSWQSLASIMLHCLYFMRLLMMGIAVALFQDLSQGSAFRLGRASAYHFRCVPFVFGCLLRDPWVTTLS